MKKAVIVILETTWSNQDTEKRFRKMIYDYGLNIDKIIVVDETMANAMRDFFNN